MTLATQQKVYNVNLPKIIFATAVILVVGGYIVSKFSSFSPPLSVLAGFSGFIDSNLAKLPGLIQYVSDKGGDITKYVAGALALAGPAVAVGKVVYDKGIAAKNNVIQAKNNTIGLQENTIGLIGGQADTAMTQLNDTVNTLKSTQDELASVKEQNASLTTLNNELTTRMDSFGSVEDGFEATIKKQTTELDRLHAIEIQYNELRRQAALSVKPSLQ